MFGSIITSLFSSNKCIEVQVEDILKDTEMEITYKEKIIFDEGIGKKNLEYVSKYSLIEWILKHKEFRWSMKDISENSNVTAEFLRKVLNGNSGIKRVNRNYEGVDIYSIYDKRLINKIHWKKLTKTVSLEEIIKGDDIEWCKRGLSQRKDIDYETYTRITSNMCIPMAMNHEWLEEGYETEVSKSKTRELLSKYVLNKNGTITLKGNIFSINKKVWKNCLSNKSKFASIRPKDRHEDIEALVSTFSYEDILKLGRYGDGKGLSKNLKLSFTELASFTNKGIKVSFHDISSTASYDELKANIKFIDRKGLSRNRNITTKDFLELTGSVQSDLDFNERANLSQYSDVSLYFDPRFCWDRFYLRKNKKITEKIKDLYFS